MLLHTTPVLVKHWQMLCPTAWLHTSSLQVPLRHRLVKLSCDLHWPQRFQVSLCNCLIQSLVQTFIVFYQKKRKEKFVGRSTKVEQSSGTLLALEEAGELEEAQHENVFEVGPDDGQ